MMKWRFWKHITGSKHCCLNCHFFSCAYVTGGGREIIKPWSQENRDDRHLIDFSFEFDDICAKGVWNTAFDHDLKPHVETIIKDDRKDECFFIEYREWMTIKTASELQRIRNENRHLKRSYLYTLIGLWLAGLAIAANVIVEIVKYLK